MNDTHTSLKSSYLSLQFSQYPGLESFLGDLFFFGAADAVIATAWLSSSPSDIVLSSWIRVIGAAVVRRVARRCTGGCSLLMAALTSLMYDEGMLVVDNPLRRSTALLCNWCISLLVPALPAGPAAVEDIICDLMADVTLDCCTPDAIGSLPGRVKPGKWKRALPS